MDIISYVGEEVDSKRERDISKLIKTQKNPVVMMIIKKLSDQYKNYNTSRLHKTLVKNNFKIYKSIKFPILNWEDRIYLNSNLPNFNN